MKRSRYSDERIANALRQAETGTAVADAWRQLGVSDATFYVWKKLSPLRCGRRSRINRRVNACVMPEAGQDHSRSR